MEIANMEQQLQQEMDNQFDQALNCTKSQQQQQQQQQQQEKKPRPHPEQALKCPRCDSTNTKFCYYNNYSLSQPRYFCKGCRRYWTKGGSLRNVPVGGGCRKNKRSSSSSKKSQEPDLNPNPLPLPPLSFDPKNLSLAFSNDAFMLPNPNPSPDGFLDILRNGLNVDRINPTEPYQSLYCGLGDNPVGSGMMFPFDGGIMSGTDAVTATESAIDAVTTAPSACGQGSSCKALEDQGGESKMVIGLHNWAVGGEDHGGTNLGFDSARDYWNGVGTNWHGLINSSLM